MRNFYRIINVTDQMQHLAAYTGDLILFDLKQSKVLTETHNVILRKTHSCQLKNESKAHTPVNRISRRLVIG